MSRYALYNGDLGALLEDGTPRPKLRLILRARAKARGSPFVDKYVFLYRQVGESIKLSPKETAALERIASAAPTRKWWQSR